MGHTAPTQVEGARIQNPMGLAYSFLPAHCKYFPLPKIQLFTSLKVRQIRNDFFKPTFLPKNECNFLFFTTYQLVFVLFLEEDEDTKKTFRNYLSIVLAISHWIFGKHPNICSSAAFEQSYAFVEHLISQWWKHLNIWSSVCFK